MFDKPNADANKKSGENKLDNYFSVFTKKWKTGLFYKQQHFIHKFLNMIDTIV